MVVGLCEGKFKYKTLRWSDENGNKKFCSIIQPGRRIGAEWGPHWCHQNSWLENVIYETISNAIFELPSLLNPRCDAARRVQVIAISFGHLIRII